MTVDIILLKLYVNVKSEDREDTLSNKDEVKRHVNIMIWDQVYLELTTFRLIMIPIGDIFDLAHKREYQSIP